MAGVMKIECPACRCRAANRKTVWLDDAKTLANVYYTCTNPDCNMRFSFNLDGFRVISPSDLQSDSVVKTLLQRLKPDEKQMALDILLSDGA
ncbi:transcriptional regulator [Salmonella enterica subsp. enterica]|nr:transcriptional regulator [Salmonella enterica subsp. enterica]EDQ2988627.1 ogr/Delta-like zinc finger family protein [Salmonella enterica subsp. enterica]